MEEQQKIYEPVNAKVDSQKDEINLLVIPGMLKRFFSGIFNGISSGIIFSLRLIKRNSKLVAVCTLLGIASGIIYSLFSKPYYCSKMIIRSNSAIVNFNIINLFLMNLNEMCNQENYKQLSEVLGISPDVAQHLKKFDIEKNIQPVDYAIIYAQYYEVLSKIEDESLRKELLESLTKITASDIYSIMLDAYNPEIFSNISQPFVNLFEKNPYFVKDKEILLSHLHKQETAFTEELIKLDSLKTIMTKIMVKGNHQIGESSATNIILGETQKITPLPAFDKFTGYLTQVLTINREIQDKQSIVHLISPFNNQKKSKRLNPIEAGMFGGATGFITGIILAVLLIFMRYFIRLEA